VNDEISEINADAVTDIQARYAGIVSELDEVNVKIAEMEAETVASSDTTAELQDQWKDVTTEIKDSEKSVEDYQKSIDKITESMSTLSDDATGNIADRYVALGEEIEKNQDRLDELNAIGTLGTDETEEKLKLEEEVAAAIAEQALAR
jgi:septal ring factor EnvC (AmiA/AmiB activator)